MLAALDHAINAHSGRARLPRGVVAVFALLFLASCGGGGQGADSSNGNGNRSGTTSVNSTSNTAAIASVNTKVDAASAGQGADGGLETNARNVGIVLNSYLYPTNYYSNVLIQSTPINFQIGSSNVPKACLNPLELKIWGRTTSADGTVSPWGLYFFEDQPPNTYGTNTVSTTLHLGGALGSPPLTYELYGTAVCKNADPNFVEPDPPLPANMARYYFRPTGALEYDGQISLLTLFQNQSFLGLQVRLTTQPDNQCIAGAGAYIFDHFTDLTTGRVSDQFLSYAVVPTFGDFFNTNTTVNIDLSFPQIHEFWGSEVCQNGDPQLLFPSYHAGFVVPINAQGWPVIATQPVDIQAAIGASATFSLAVNGTNRAIVTWQRSADGVQWPTVGQSTTLAFVVTEDDRNAKWRAQVCNASHCLFSNVVGVTLLGAPALKQGDSLVAGGGTHSLAVSSSGVVWSWGSNNGGALGRSDPSQRPQPIPTLSHIRSVAAGAWYSAALDTQGAVYAWGWGENIGDAIGSASLDNGVPTWVQGLPSITAIASRYTHVLALASDGRVWGFGPEGALALGPLIGNAGVRLIPGTADMRQVAAGEIHSLSLALNGQVWSWGRDNSGQLGTADGDRDTPEIVPGLTDVVAIAASANASFALRTDGTVWSWGNAGEIGRPGDPSVPAPIPGLTGISGLGAGHHGAWAWQAGGATWGWGDNSAGQVGVGMPDQGILTPTLLPTFKTPLQIQGGERHTLGVSRNGAVSTWGSNEGRQLSGGPGPFAPLPIPSGFVR